MKKIIVALDVHDKTEALSLVKTLSPWVDLFKVGPILFLTSGPGLIRELKDRGKEVFLDLKFHDIPATVQRAVESAQQLGVYSLTLHSAGGEEMLKAASGVAPRPKLWAVTILTSQAAAQAQVVERALLAKKGGCDGVIASPLEIEAIKKACGKDFAVITPGVRLEDRHDDQKRTATPAAAIQAGADFIVVGRPIIAAPDPAAVARLITEQIGNNGDGSI
jgi:orotidine-5'-phosphate decarboxylase